MQLHVILFALLWVGACGYALAEGGKPERIVGGLFVAGALLSPLSQWLQHAPQQVFLTVELGPLLIDTVILLVILWMALASARFWPMAMASMQAALPMAHVANAIAPGAMPRAYFAMTVFLAFPQLALLAIATWRHRRRLHRYGVDPAWTRDLPADYRAGGPAHER